MSIETWVAYLQQKTNEAERGQRVGLAGFAGGIVSMGIGIIFDTIMNKGNGTYLLGIGLMILGIFMLVIAIFVTMHYSGKYKNLKQELEKMTALDLTCRNCGKVLPKGSFDLCPFCEESLK